MDCPNDRYVNDEQICQAVVGMLARVGVKVDLNAEPKSKFFASISAAGGFDSSFYLLGWTPSTLESFNVFQYIMGCRDPKTNWGGNNVGDYCNPKVDALAREALQEPDEEKRDEIFARSLANVARSTTWATFRSISRRWPGAFRSTTHVIQRPDNYYIFAWVKKD